MSQLNGQCHCGTIKFTVDSSGGPQGLRKCNCSICRRKNVVMATAKLPEFQITAGEDKLNLYQWNTKIAKHYFCSVCGIYTHHQRRAAPDEYGFNAACIERIKVADLEEVPTIDGAAMTLVGE